MSIYRQPVKVGSYRKRDHATGQYKAGGAVPEMKYGDMRKGESWNAYETRKNAEFQRHQHAKYKRGGKVRGYDDGGFVSELGGTGDDWNPGDQGMSFPSADQSAPIADTHMDQPWSGNAGPPEAWGKPEAWTGPDVPMPQPRPQPPQAPGVSDYTGMPGQPHGPLGPAPSPNDPTMANEDWSNLGTSLNNARNAVGDVLMPTPRPIGPQASAPQPQQRNVTPEDLVQQHLNNLSEQSDALHQRAMSRPPAPVGGNSLPSVPANAFTGPPAPQSYPFTGPPLPQGAQPVQYRPPAPTGGQQGFGQGNPYQQQQQQPLPLPPGVLKQGFAPVAGPFQPIINMVRTAFSAPGSQGQDANTRSPLDIARSWVGANEHAQREALTNFIGTVGGQKVNPETTAWCAAWVNGVLAHNGQQGSNSLAARSFLQVGTDTTGNPQPGDIAVFSRNGPNSGQGHVGFYTGTNKDGSINFIAGNQGNAVANGTLPASRLLGIRRAGPADLQQAQQNVAAKLNNGPGEYGTPSSGNLDAATPQNARPASYRQPAPTGGNGGGNGGGGYNSDMTLDRYRNPNPPIDSNAMDHRRWNGPALIATGASIAGNVGGLGTALAQGLNAGQKSMDEQRKQLSTEAGVNNKAQQLYQQAQEHLDRYQRLTPAQGASIHMQEQRLDLSRQRMSREDAGPTQAQILSAVQGEKRRLMATPEGSQMEETALEQTARANIQRIIQGGTQQRQQQQQQPGGNIPMPSQAPVQAAQPTPVGNTRTFTQGTAKKVKDGPDSDPSTWQRVQ